MKITTEALIDSPIETVWRAFNDPADIVQWDASDDWRTTWASNDLQRERDSRARRDGDRYDDRHDYDAEHDPSRRKRKSMLGELFDF